MDLIYTDELRKDVGVIHRNTFDFQISVDKDNCDFEVETSIKDNVLQKGFFVYVEGEEYGGRVDSIQIDTGNDEVHAKGRSWRGILGSKIISPPPGETHLTMSGDANTIIAQLLYYCELGDLFVAESAGAINIPSYTFKRYTSLYEGLVAMLNTVNAKLKLRWEHGMVKVEAVPMVDYSNEAEISSDLFDFRIESSTGINHIIGLGQGELLNRQVVHRYARPDGSISEIQYFTGLDEITATYEYTQAESLDDLISATEKKLKELSTKDSLQITAHDLNADIGDKFTAYDINTGISISQYVTDKIVTINGDGVQIQYKVGNI